MSRQVFVITVTGEMDQSLRDEFADVGITVDHSVTRLRLVSAAAAARHGLLNRSAALGRELLDVHQVEEGSPDRW